MQRAGKHARSRVDQHHINVYARSGNDTCCVRQVRASSSPSTGVRDLARHTRSTMQISACVNQVQNVVPTFSKDHDLFALHGHRAHDVRFFWLT
jgi:hypothetical protein